MSKHERILLDFANNLRNKQASEYETSNLIEALEAGAHAINALCSAQEAANKIADLFIDHRCYKGD